MRDARNTACLGLAGGLLAAAVCAQDPPLQTADPQTDPTQTEGEWFGGRYWMDWESVTGDWGGIRTDLSDIGISFGGGWIFDWSRVFDGGLRRGSAFRNLLDANLLFDLDTIAGIPRTQVFTSFVNQVGPDASAELVGDIQVFDNMDSFNFHVMYDLWLETWLGDSVRVKVGKMDANTEFAYLEEGLIFIHSTAGFPPTILALPTYPFPAFGVAAYAYPGTPEAGVFAGAGLYDGALQDGIDTGKLGPGNLFSNDESSALFLIGEAGYRWSGGERAGGGRVFGGVWHGTAEFDRFDGGVENGSTGWYVMAEQKVWREVPEDPQDNQGLALMASYGWADEDVSEFAQTFLFGATYTGAIPGRNRDRIGALVSHADLSDEPAAGFPQDETAYELYYQLQLTPAFSLQPVLSYIVNPSGDPTIDDALVGTLRGVIAF